MERHTGARGLRSIMESLLLDTMYDLPSKNEVAKVIIDAEVVEGRKPPILVHDDELFKKKA